MNSTDPTNNGDVCDIISPGPKSKYLIQDNDMSLGYETGSAKEANVSMQYSINRNKHKELLIPTTSPSHSMHSMLSFTSSIYKSNRKYCGLSLYTCGWICFFIMGTFNNFINVVILSSAKNLSNSFDSANLIGLIQWSLTSISFFTKLLNTLYLQTISHKIRILITVIFNLIGIIGLALSLYSPKHSIFHNFTFVLIYLVILGGTCSFSENVIVGYLKVFPPKLAGSWSSGTGFAGLFGSFFYLLCSSILNLKNEEIYLLIAPSMIFYLIAFVCMNESNLKKRQNDHFTHRVNQNHQRIEDEDEYDDDGGDTIISYDVYKESLYQKVMRCYKLCIFRAWMMAFVYLFEYIISVGLASISNTNLSTKRQDDIYIYLSVCYQIGVFISRSSVSVFSTNRFGMLAILQFVNVIIWHFQCWTLFFSLYIGVWFEYLLMIYVGLLGGMMYVNIIHDILCNRENIPNKNDRELCLNIVLVHIVFGMFSSSIYTLVMDNTFFNQLVEKSN